MVDERMEDGSDTSRPPVRHLWDSLDVDRQRLLIEQADTVQGIAACQRWMVSDDPTEQDRLLGSVLGTLTAHADERKTQ